jgi:hypothetical protein
MSDIENKGYDQRFWAISDPNWGVPYIIPGTMFALQDQSIDAVRDMPEYSIYSGQSIFSLPDGTRGDWEKLRKHGFKLVQVKINHEMVSTG